MTMSDAEFDTFVESSKAALQVKQDALESRFNLGHYASWSYDSSDSSLCLADDSGCVRMKADVIQIGSYSLEKCTWVWAWANLSLPAIQRERSEPLRGLYNRTGFNLFENEACEADESMAWELAAMAVEHLNAQGCYRGPAKNLLVFFAIIRLSMWPH